jgi:hypothetical protein
MKDEIQVSKNIDVMKFQKSWVVTVFTHDGTYGKTFGFDTKALAIKSAKAWTKLQDVEIRSL